VKPPGHHDYRVAFEVSENQFALVALDGTAREMWQIRVLDFCFYDYMVSQIPQTRAQHDAAARLKMGALAQVRDRFLDLLVEAHF
jgi:hypothetical protein